MSAALKVRCVGGLAGVVLASEQLAAVVAAHGDPNASWVQGRMPAAPELSALEDSLHNRAVSFALRCRCEVCRTFLETPQPSFH